MGQSPAEPGRCSTRKSGLRISRGRIQFMGRNDGACVRAPASEMEGRIPQMASGMVGQGRWFQLRPRSPPLAPRCRDSACPFTFFLTLVFIFFFHRVFSLFKIGSFPPAVLICTVGNSSLLMNSLLVFLMLYTGSGSAALCLYHGDAELCKRYIS